MGKGECCAGPEKGHEHGKGHEHAHGAKDPKKKS
jgi:hypothetical protein